MYKMKAHEELNFIFRGLLAYLVALAVAALLAFVLHRPTLFTVLSKGVILPGFLTGFVIMRYHPGRSQPSSKLNYNRYVRVGVLNGITWILISTTLDYAFARFDVSGSEPPPPGTHLLGGLTCAVTVIVISWRLSQTSRLR